MRYNQIARTAARSVFQNGLRTALTMLGLVIGISSVIVLVGIGDGSNQQVREQMRGLGGDTLTAYVFDGQLAYDDVHGVSNLPGVKDAAPSKVVPKKLSAGATVSKRASIEATDEHYLDVRNLKLQAGRNLAAVDREMRSKVIVLGGQVASDLFGMQSAVGKQVKLDGDAFTVVGVLENQGQSMGLNTGDVALVPFSTAVGMGEGAQVDFLYAKARNESDVAAGKADLRAYLAAQPQVKAGGFDVISQDEMLRAGGDIGQTMTVLLAGIAAISLVVAGIGVMNVMLVSVTERTREIGVKKALGARRTDILVQFLLEALVLSVAGGLLGIVAGVGFGMLAKSAGLAFVVSGGVIVVAVAASTAIGLVFGIFPAWRASRKNPIEALRAE